MMGIYKITNNVKLAGTQQICIVSHYKRNGTFSRFKLNFFVYTQMENSLLLEDFKYKIVNRYKKELV